MEHGRRHETQQKKDLKRPLTRSSPTTTHSARMSRMSRMSRGYNSSAQSPFRRRTEPSFRKTSNFGARGTLPFGSKSRQRTGTKKQISLAEWKQVEKMKIIKQIAEAQDVTKNPIHRVCSPPFEKPATSGSLTSRTFPSNKKDKAQFTQDQSQTEKLRPVEHPSLVSPAKAKSRAIEEKRKEIEKVYQRDCGTFSRVVKKLVSKDPSLVPHIRFAVQENLKEIGLRCAAAMNQFMTQYDLSAASQETQTHT